MSLQLKGLEPCDGLFRCDESLSLEGLRLLVVDDHLDTRDLLTLLLEGEGAKVIAVASVSEALEALEGFKPDILISDIKLPDEDGYALIRTVRKLEAKRGGQIPAIAFTGYAGKENCRRALSAGFHRHIPKPIDLAEFTAVVTSLASGILQPPARLSTEQAQRLQLQS